MNRRDLLALGLCATGAACTPPIGRAETARPNHRLKPLMHVGSQRGPTTPETLDFLKRHGVDHVCGYPICQNGRAHWTADELERTRDLCNDHGLSLDMVALPFLTSSHIDREKRGAIVLGESPERDRDIERIQGMIAHCAQVGIPAFKYNLSLLGVLRTQPTAGRGGSSYQTWKLMDARPRSALTRAGRVDADLAWERIEYFLNRIIPVCNEYRIRAACHPHDPGVPPDGYQGICRVLGTVDGLRRFLSIQAGPYHGLNFCVGSVAEMLQHPCQELPPIVEEFARNKKIFNVHLRNIRGRRDDFQEVYIDEGDLDMVHILRVLRDTDYPYLVMPDHVPRHSEDRGAQQAFAHCFGYIQGILQALEQIPRAPLTVRSLAK
ncbi:mannonate dehydratase [Rubinisphaera sp. JC750]|uniref:mannonate dehydratase n=1 Tax=Rubinisphaera sp. JC750 TaxID=2898658 RepID=UPI001F01BFBD|nr:mannonate dehydratase [Rubinisphaera sp. JC750]